jgi:hypothetical protein
MMAALVAMLLLPRLLQATTLEEIESRPDLTPEVFAAYFARFEFKFQDEVQAPDVFLAARAGDCDDYATLAATVLQRRGYTPRLITVRMAKVVHVVCYVEETHSYLDYNLRAASPGVVRCGPEISDVARMVAKSYRAKWVSASEFTYDGDAKLKRLVRTVVERGDRQIASLSR